MLVMTMVLALGSTDFACEYAAGRWAEAGLAPPCKVSSRRDAQRRWQLSEAQATCAFDASSQPDDSRDSKRHAAWLSCALKWPEAWALVVGTLLTWDFRTDLSGLIDRLPANIAARLLDLKRGPAVAIAQHLLKQDSSRLLPLLQDQRLEADERAELAWDALRAGQAPVHEVGFVNALLIGPLRQGHLFFAARAWLELPPATRATLAKDPALLKVAGDEPDDPAFTLGPELALGLIAIGHRDAATAVVPAPPVLEGASDGGVGKPHPELISDAARWALTGVRRSSAWDAALEMGGAGEWELLASIWPFLAPHEALFRRHFAKLDEIDVEAAVTDSQPARSFDEALAAANLQGMIALKRQLTVASAPTALPDAGVVLLPPPFPSPFVEEARSTATRANVPVRLADGKSPRGFWVVRAEKQGRRLVALSLSQRFDPVGEVSPGGYWLSLSTDEGAQWKHVYLSLGAHRPFWALRRSKVPLIDANDVVRLAMEEAPLDERSVTFPPVSMHAPTKRPLVILKARLSDLERDTDGDALSDLTEARLLLDWTRVDTDGDGVNDGDDATPRLDDRQQRTTLAEMYNAFFEDFLTGGRQPRALVLSPNARVGDVSAAFGTPRAADLDDVRFLEGAPAALAGLKPLVRIINLTTEELGALRERYGTFYPMRVEVIVEGPDHAYVSWSESWRGGSCRIDRDNTGQLVVTQLSSWIT